MNVAEYKRKKYKEGMNDLTPKEWFGISVACAFDAWDIEDPEKYKEFKRIKSSLYKRYAGGLGDTRDRPSDFYYASVLQQDPEKIFRKIDACTSGRFSYNQKAGEVGFAEEKDLLMFALSLN